MNPIEIQAAECNVKPKRKGKLAKLAPKLPDPPVPNTQAEALRSLRLLVSQYEDLRDQSRATKQRMGDRTNQETGEVLVNPLPEEMKAHLGTMADALDRMGDTLESRIKKTLKVFQIYTLFLEHVPGVGPTTAGKLIADIDITRCEKVSALHRVCGLAVRVDEEGKGHAQRATAGVKLDFHARLKVALFMAFGAMVRNRLSTRYTRRCAEYKHRLLTSSRYNEEANTFDGRKGGKFIVNNMSWRPGAQLLLEDLYIVWRTLEGLPVWPSYHAGKLGHVHNGKIAVNEARLLSLEEALDLVRDEPVAAAAE